MADFMYRTCFSADTAFLFSLHHAADACHREAQLPRCANILITFSNKSSPQWYIPRENTAHSDYVDIFDDTTKFLQSAIRPWRTSLRMIYVKQRLKDSECRQPTQRCLLAPHLAASYPQVVSKLELQHSPLDQCLHAVCQHSHNQRFHP